MHISEQSIPCPERCLVWRVNGTAWLAPVQLNSAIPSTHTAQRDRSCSPMHRAQALPQGCARDVPAIPQYGQPRASTAPCPHLL